jgi:hypothetical protein
MASENAETRTEVVDEKPPVSSCVVVERAEHLQHYMPTLLQYFHSFQWQAKRQKTGENCDVQPGVNDANEKDM